MKEILMENLHNLNEKVNSYFPDHVDSGNRVDVYDSVEKEYSAILNGVAIRNVSDRNIIAVRGKDSLEFLNRIATNNLKVLPVAGFMRTLFTNEKGRIIDRTTLISLDNKYLLISNCNCDTRIKNWIDKYIITEEVTTEVVTGSYSLFEVYGYQAQSYLSMFCGDSINYLPDNRITFISYEDIHFFVFKQKETEKISKFMIFSAIEHSEKLVQYMNENKSVFDFSFIGERAYEIFRIKNGIPKFPNELNDEYNPHEVNLLSDVSFDKGCYIGQEVIARLETYDKVQKKMMGAVIDGNLLPDRNSDIINSAGEIVGKLTSVAKLPENESKIGLVYVRKAHSLEDNELFIKSNDHPIKITLKGFPIEL